MTPLFRKFLGMNWVLTLNMYALLAIGVVAVYAAGWMKEEPTLVNAWNRQLIWIAIGTVVFFAASLIDYSWVNWGALPFYLAGITLSVFALFGDDSVVGHDIRVSIGPLTFQPSQVALAGGIILVAIILGHIHKFSPFFRNPFVKLGVTGIACLLPFAIVLLQGDFGSAMVWLPVGGAMILVGNVPFRYILTVILCGLMVIPWAYYFGLKPHQKERITVFLDMLSGRKVDTQGSAYAASYIIKAVGSGGFSGKGFKYEKSVNNLGFIPKRTALNDFIFAVYAEEWGFRGGIALLAAYAVILLQGLFIAFYSRDAVGRLICAGTVGMFFAHIFQHVGMNLLIMPITGIPLPFLSYGGTFTVICMFLCGMLQSVWVHRGTAAQRIATAAASPPPAFAPSLGL